MAFIALCRLLRINATAKLIPMMDRTIGTQTAIRFVWLSLFRQLGEQCSEANEPQKVARALTAEYGEGGFDKNTRGLRRFLAHLLLAIMGAPVIIKRVWAQSVSRRSLPFLPGYRRFWRRVRRTAEGRDGP
jgi:hypothetical protein